MRDYAKVSPKFWIGETGRALRAAGHEAQIVAFYLMTSPHSHMLGVYYLPMSLLAHETGLPADGAKRGMARAIASGFCDYDEVAEMVYVYEMAKWQVDVALKPGDKRVIQINSEYAGFPKCKFLADFFEKYSAAFHLSARRDNATHAMPHTITPRSQEQEQEQEQRAGTGAENQKLSRKPSARAAVNPGESKTGATWAAYAGAYALRYAVDPVRNGKINGQLSLLVDRLGADDAPHVAAHFVRSANAYYVQRGHAIDALLRDAEKLRTEWKTGTAVTSIGARQGERLAHHGNLAAELKQEMAK